MWYIAVGAIVVIWLVVAGAVNLATAYRYTKASLFALAIVLVASGGFSQWLAATILTDAARGTQVVVGALITVPLFVLGGNVMAETWRRLRPKESSDEEGGRQRREEESLARLTAIERELESISARQREVEGLNRDRLDRQSLLRTAVEKWEQGGGVARIRATKVHQWQEELAQLEGSALENRRQELAEQVAREKDPVRREQLEVQGYMAELEQLARLLAQPNRQLDELKQRHLVLTAERDSIRQELARVRQEIQDFRRRRESQGDRIPLE